MNIFCPFCSTILTLIEGSTTPQYHCNGQMCQPLKTFKSKFELYFIQKKDNVTKVFGYRASFDDGLTVISVNSSGGPITEYFYHSSKVTYLQIYFDLDINDTARSLQQNLDKIKTYMLFK